eukprot:5074511-Pyramimonas_sp.AAC.2
MLLRFTGPPVLMTARMHSTPQRPFTSYTRINRRITRVLFFPPDVSANLVVTNDVAWLAQALHADDLMHPVIATACSNLAGLLMNQGNYDTAQELYMHALKIREDVYGVSHSAVATSLTNLANLYLAMGKLDQAEELYIKAMDIDEEVRFGPLDEEG